MSQAWTLNYALPASCPYTASELDEQGLTALRRAATDPATIIEIEALLLLARSGQWSIRWCGVMADEVEKENPDAVHKDTHGFRIVDFSKLGYLPQVVSITRLAPLSVPLRQRAA